MFWIELKKNIYKFLGYTYKTLRHWLAPYSVCRFTVSCSQYAHEQLKYEKKLRAILNITRRILICNPFYNFKLK